jgi:adenosine deaminase
MTSFMGALRTDSLEALREINEVQHGIAAAQSEPVMRFLANSRIRLNICPTSNVMLGTVQ